MTGTVMGQHSSLLLGLRNTLSVLPQLLSTYIGDKEREERRGGWDLLIPFLFSSKG